MRLSFFILYAVSLLLSSVAMADTAMLAVIVPHSQATRSLSSAELALIYWRKKLYWADGQRMQPVNFPTESPVRRQFSLAILGGLPETQTEYWNVMYFHGTSPPHVVASQEAMLRFVAETQGAIGYVDACKVDGRVKVLLWIGADGVSTNAPAKQDCAQ